MFKIKIKTLITKIWYWCASKCETCWEWTQKLELYLRDDIEKLKKSIEKTFDLVDIDFLESFTFYWSNILKNNFFDELKRLCFMI